MSAARGRLTLVLPGYARGIATDAGVAGSGDAASGASLRRLLARASWSPHTDGTTAALLAAFGLAPDTSLAALLGRAELDLAEPGWLRADPVHFRADAKLVMLIAPSAGEPTPEEADALLDELRARLPEFVWRRGAEARRWYVRMPQLEATPTLGPAWLHGRSLTPFFPQDPAHRRWRQAMTEAQMVMHEAATNAERATPLNALWIWGGGRAPAPAPAPTTLALALGKDLLLHGAALAAGIERASAADAPRLAAALARGGVLALAGAPFGALDAAGTVIEEAEAYAELAWSALARGDATAVELIAEGARGTVTKAARWRLWQRAAPGVFGDPHAVSSA